MREEKNKRFWEGVLVGAIAALFIAAIVAGGLFLWNGPIQKWVAADAEVRSKMQVLEDCVDQHYLFDIDQKAVNNNIYKGYINGLDDPYSAYYTPEEYQKVTESVSGSYSGIGVGVNQNEENGMLMVVHVYDNTPAKTAGIQNGDYICEVNGTDVTGMNMNDTVTLMKGEAGTDVLIKVYRESDQNYHDITVTRQNIETQTVASKMLNEAIGYIGVTEFDSVTSQQFKDALSDLESQGMQGLIIDLRNNPGGVLTTAVDMADQILPEGKIVYTEDKNKKGETYYSDEETKLSKPLVVLVNGGSASASEIFAGAVKDYDMGTLVGTKTYGKGIVQNLYPLTDGSAVKLTIARYFTPSGTCIHEVGIEPDIQVELSEEAKNAGSEITQEQDNQLQQGIQVIQEKIAAQ